MDVGGNPCVKAQAYISILDLVRNRPVRFSDTDLARYQPEPDTVIEAPVKKIAAPKEFVAEKTLVVRRSDIDFNMHVHNTTYLTLAMEVLPEELYKEQNFQAIRINFKKALLLDDVATIKLAQTEQGYTVAIYKEADQLCCLVDFIV
jgi:medium-chain acyl-[acyl-carrier-protein] hydrolase